jgi:hypothetical protein
MDPSFLSNQSDEQTAMLVVVLLLLSWLLMRVRRLASDEDKGPAFRRPDPLSIHELGHFAFQAARSRDTRTWRALFLNGAEARSLLGTQADRWLAENTEVELGDKLDLIAGCIPAQAAYAGCEQQQDGRVALRVRPLNGEDVLIAIGRPQQIGQLWRLVGVT